MKVYRQDPTLFRDHFHRQVGGALPGFKGARVQYGDGIGSFLELWHERLFHSLEQGLNWLRHMLKRLE